MVHTWEEIHERKKIDGVKFEVGDWVSEKKKKDTYGYIDNLTIYRNRERTRIMSVSYSIMVVVNHGNIQYQPFLYSDDEEAFLPMQEDLNIANLKSLINLSLDTKDKEYFLKLSDLLIKKERDKYEKD